MRGLMLAAVVVVAGACAPAGPPSAAAHITGTVTQVANAGGTILVEEDPTLPSGGAKASVTITSSTRLWNVGGSRIAAADVRIGAVVRVWFDGPVAESYPVQGRAADIAVVP